MYKLTEDNTCDVDGLFCWKVGTTYRCGSGCDFDVCDQCIKLFEADEEQKALLYPPRAVALPPVQPQTLATSGGELGQSLDVLKRAILRQVLHFTERVSKGIRCIYFRERSHQRVPAIYTLDNVARYLIVFSGNALQNKEVACPLTSLVEVCRFQDAGEQYFPKAVVDMLAADETERLAMVVFTRNDGKKIRFCLLEESSESCDAFIEAINVLAVYMRTDKNNLSRTCL